MKYLAIGEICELLNGFAFKSKEYTNEGIRIIRIANVQKGYIEDSAPCYYPKVQLSTFEKSMLSAGDLLISLTGNVGRVGLLPESMIPAALNQRVGCLRIKNDHEMDIKYLFHLLNSDYFENACIESSNGAAQKNLSTNWLKEFLIPVPTLVKQKTIARVFEHIVLLLRLEKRRVDYFDDLVKSRFVEMFGDWQSGYRYELQKLGSLLSVEPQNGLYKPQKYYVNEGGVPIVRVDAFRAGFIEDFGALKRLECSQSEIDTYGLSENDIVINRVNGSIERVGKIAWIRGLVELTVFESNMMRFHVDESKLDLAYITVFLNSDDIRQQIKSCARIANQCSINQGNVMDFEIPLPPLALQHEFAAFAAQVDKLKFDFDFLVSFSIPSICLFCLKLDP